MTRSTARRAFDEGQPARLARHADLGAGLRRAGEYYMDIPYDPEVYVRTRILALVEYINRLQRK